jgi:hypothetical protein
MKRRFLVIDSLGVLHGIVRAKSEREAIKALDENNNQIEYLLLAVNANNIDLFICNLKELSKRI